MDTGHFPFFDLYVFEGVDLARKVEIENGVEHSFIGILVGKTAEKLKAVQIQIGFLFYFAMQSEFRAFVEVDKSSRNAVFALGWLSGPFDDKQLATAVENQRGGGATWVEVHFEIAGLAAHGVLLKTLDHGMAATRTVVEMLE